MVSNSQTQGSDMKMRANLPCLQIHFTFAGKPGEKVGETVALATLDVFDRKWDQF